MCMDISSSPYRQSNGDTCPPTTTTTTTTNQPATTTDLSIVAYSNNRRGLSLGQIGSVDFQTPSRTSYKAPSASASMMHSTTTNSTTTNTLNTSNANSTSYSNYYPTTSSILPVVPPGRDSPERGGSVDYDRVNGLLRELAVQREGRHHTTSAHTSTTTSTSNTATTSGAIAVPSTPITASAIPTSESTTRSLGGRFNFSISTTTGRPNYNSNYNSTYTNSSNSNSSSTSNIYSSTSNIYSSSNIYVSSGGGVDGAPVDISPLKLTSHIAPNTGTSTSASSSSNGSSGSSTSGISTSTSGISIDDRGMKRCRGDSEDYVDANNNILYSTLNSNISTSNITGTSSGRNVRSRLLQQQPYYNNDIYCSNGIHNTVGDGDDNTTMDMS